MSNVLIVEPDYRSKFPPLGLLRLSTFHKDKGDRVTFVRGKDANLRQLKWHKIYVSSLFTYELPRTVKTIKYYRTSVDNDDDIICGGIGATLLPEYIRQRVKCRVIPGPLSTAHIIDGEKKPLAKYLPDYHLIDTSPWTYQPKESYFCRVTTGCIRKCKFCAVPILEPIFSYFQSLRSQIRAVDENYGKRQNLVLLDNNVLACGNKLTDIISDIRHAGFEKEAKRNNRQRSVDFNQGIDARLIDARTAGLLATIALSPVRLAFDYSGIKNAYIKAIKLMAINGFDEFTNYVMFNFKDTPKDFYERIRLNATLSKNLNVRITSFPMKYAPVNDVSRRHIAEGWQWRYLRGMQCVLLATHGLVSPNLVFFEAAFGSSLKDFLEILSMPDRYIIYRKKYRNNGTDDWKRMFRRLSPSGKNRFLNALEVINRSRSKKDELYRYKEFKALLEHYYPDGQPTPCV